VKKRLELPTRRYENEKQAHCHLILDSGASAIKIRLTNMQMSKTNWFIL